ncbi:MAG: hypothetical protein AB7O28_05980 [Vicinamibacterales bacterium]
MSTLVKLIVVGLILNGCVQLARSTWAFYEFQDAVQQAVLFSSNQTAEQFKARVADIAREQELPLEPASVNVVFQNVQAKITATYVDDVHLVPGAYVYQWRHHLDVDMRRMAY